MLDSEEGEREYYSREQEIEELASSGATELNPPAWLKAQDPRVDLIHLTF